MIIAAGPPLIAILIALGCLGWLGFRLNMFLNVMTPLIMVISFSDSMQLTFAARDRLLRGESKHEAFRNAILVVGPACALTHATAGLSFIALQFSDSHLIRTFGEAGLAATVIAFIAVLTLVPLFGILLIRSETKFAARVKGSDRAIDALRTICGWIAERMVRRPFVYSIISIVIVGGLAFLYTHLDPRYRLADQVPDKQQAVEASGRLDAKLTGANPIDVLIELPKGQSLYDQDSLDTIAAVHEIVETQAGVGNVWSLETLRRWLAEKEGKHDTATLKQYVDILPEHLTRRFVARGRRRGGGVGPDSRHRREPAPSGHRRPRQDARRCAQRPSRHQHRRHRTCGDRGAQQRQHDRQAEQRPDDRDHLRRRLHRARLPLASS